MIWLAVIALAIWVLVEHNRASRLDRELTDLRRRLAELGPAPEPRRAFAEPTPAMTAAARAAADAAAAALAEQTRASQISPPAARPEPEPALALEAASVAPPIVGPAPAPPPPRDPLFTRASLEKWLAERGLAWIGGSALVIGGGFLVGYAAQQGFFTPGMRIIAAIGLGFALLGAGEAIRRGRLAGFGGHKLAAAVASGAGAAVLYGTTWAAFSLYEFIGGSTCAGLLAAIALGLLALAFLHSEALAVLALAGAFAAPLLVGGKTWSIEVLSLYLAILIAVGAVLAWLRNWNMTAWTNLAGASLWSLLAAFQQAELKCLLIGAEPLVVTAALAYAWPAAARRAVAAGVVIVASGAALTALVEAAGGAQATLIGVIAGLALPFAVAALQRRGQIPAWSQAGPAIAFVLGVLQARQSGDPALILTGLWCLQIAALVVASAWAARSDARRVVSWVGATGALTLAVVAGSGAPTGAYAPLAPATAGLALALTAAWRARGGAGRDDPRTLDIWSGASAAALLTALSVALTWRWAAIAFAVASLGFALLGRRLQWRAISLAAAASAGLGLAALMAPGLLRYALAGGAGAAYLLAVALGVAAASFVAARIVAHEAAATQTLRTLSPLAALVGAFVFLRWLAGGQSGLPFDALTEASVRTFLMAAAGLTSLLRLDEKSSRFDRWRAHAELGAAALHGLVFQIVLYNPRLGWFGDLAGGAPLLNTLAVAYLAPAIMFGIAALRIYRTNLQAGRAYSIVSGVFGLLWAALEIRRFSHGSHLAGGLESLSAAEAVAGSVLLLLTVALAAHVKPRAGGSAHPLWGDVATSLRFARPAAVGFAVVMAGIWSNPCWGMAAAPLGGWPALAGVLSGYALLVFLTAWLARDARGAGGQRQSDALVLASMALGLVLASLIVRAAFHGTDLTLGQGATQLETWSYSAVWAIVGLGFIGVSRLGGRLFLRAGLALLMITTAKVFIVDTASLSGVVRAGSFLALGVLLLLGALTARRIAQSAAPTPRPADAEAG